MAKVRLVASRPRKVPSLRGRVVQPDEVVTVPDDQYEAYVCQPANWEPVQEPRRGKPAAMKAAAAPAAGRGGE